MKLVIYSVVVTAVYLCGLSYLIWERKTQPSKQERQRNQSGPMIFAATLLFIALLVKGPMFIN